jgi:hypothetical protein
LRRHEWASRNKTWTPTTLEWERREFFDTRVTGRQEIWQAIRAALELMWEADAAFREARIQSQLQPQEADGVGPSDESRTSALATAQSILTAAEITLPTGDLAQGAYDATGNYYAMPEHVVSDPINISLVDTRSGSRGHGEFNDGKGDLTAGEETAEEGDRETENDAERRREEKGKGVLDVRNLVPIKARLSDGSQDVTISIGADETVRSVARRIAEEASVSLLFQHDVASRKQPTPANLIMSKPTNTILATYWKEDTHSLHGQDSQRRVIPHIPRMEARSRYQRLCFQPLAGEATCHVMDSLHLSSDGVSGVSIL